MVTKVSAVHKIRNVPRLWLTEILVMIASDRIIIAH